MPSTRGEAVTVSGSCGHTWTTTVRVRGSRCPKCSVTVYVRKDGTQRDPATRS